MTNSFAVPRSVEWKETAIKILNQQKLPDVTEYLELTTKEEVFDAIVSLKVRGAPAIGITAAFGLALAAKTSKLIMWRNSAANWITSKIF